MSNIPSYDLNSLINPEASKAFLNDMWNPDYGQGLYFSALHELNEHMFVPVKVAGSWVYAPHAIYDGLSLLRYLDKTHPALKLKFVMDTPASPPSFLGWLRALRLALTSRPLEKHQFINQSPYDIKFNEDLQISTIILSPEETAALSKVNLTSFFLEKLSKLFMKKFSLNHTTRWMIPVNIRGPFKEAKLSYMSASYIGVNCSMDDTANDLKLQLIEKLKKGEQWGYWLIGKIGLMGGKKMIMDGTIKSLNKKKSQWFASLSNLGNIGGDETSPELLIMPIVRWHRPLACVIYVYRQRLHLNMSFHSSLKLTEENLEQYKNEIYQSIISK